MTGPSPAVFLSYASQDAQAAQRICEALRGMGIEVWFDRSELRGGDVWDQKIRREIHECALFIPVISANTAARHEGYFRLEWNLADQRSHMMARNRVFVIPVCLDATTDAAADVPESFKRVQWTRLPAGETSPAFLERVQGLLSPAVTPTQISGNAQSEGAGRSSAPPSRLALHRAALAVVAVVLAGAAAYLAIEKPWLKPAVSSPMPVADSASAAVNPPPHSIAVLPFVNLSGDATQDYFSDGLTEELLNSLAAIEGIQVAARTSSFSFKEHPDIGTVAHKLNVATVLEGSVRRSEHTIRVTAQLINTVTGFHLWSKTYDRNLGDVLKLQTEIATEVANALKVTLLGDVPAKIEMGGTRNPAAFDAYLRGAKLYSSYVDANDLKTTTATFTEAIHLDANYALAFAGRSQAYSAYGGLTAGREGPEALNKAIADAREAIRLAPALAASHLALAHSLENSLDFTGALEAYERALTLAPGNAEALRESGRFLSSMGQFEKGISAGRRAVALDPLNRRTYNSLGFALTSARHYVEAIAAFSDAISIDPRFEASYASRGLAYYELEDLKSAASSCEIKPDGLFAQQCLAIVYDKLGRHSEAEAVLAKMKAAGKDSAAYQYATIFAQWGNSAKALEWLGTATRLSDPGLVDLTTDALMDPLRKEPRYEAAMRELKFPP